VPGDVSVGGGRKPGGVGEAVGSGVAVGIGVTIGIGVTVGTGVEAGVGTEVTVPVGNADGSPVGVGNSESNGGDWNMAVAASFPETSQVRATATKSRVTSSVAVRKCLRTVRTGIKTGAF
jgi:hypothetical protein